MNALKELITIMAILGLAAAVAAGQDASTVQTDPSLRDPGSQVRPVERPNLDGVTRPADRPMAERPAERPERPERPDRPKRPEHVRDIPKAVLQHAPDALKKMIHRLEEARHAYLERQKELLKQARNATDEEKEAIRDQLKDNREGFLERTQTLRREIHQRVHELRDKLKDRREVIDAARDDKREQTRERRGASES